MKLTMYFVCAAALISASLPAMADGTTKPNRGWDSSVELGAVATTGNTKSSNIKFRADTAHEGPRMKHIAHFEGLRTSEDGNVNAEKYYTYYKTSYKLDEIQSLFARISYEDDKFSGYDYQTDITFGYSRQLMQRENMSLEGDAGYGVRHSKLSDGTTKNEDVARMALKYDWTISESADFKQLVSVEVGSSSTITRSESSIQSAIVSDLAMKLSFTAKHQTNVPVGTENTDTETSVTLVYRF